jgi:hypothetical protein
MKVVDVKTFTRRCWPFSHFLLYGIGKNLVERFGMTSFNRFDFSGNKSFSTLLAAFMAWPSHFDRAQEEVSVDMGVVATK